MCGRYFIKTKHLFDQKRQALSEAVFELVGEGDKAEILPGCKAPVYIFSANSFRMIKMQWGFTGKNGKLVINARVETLNDKAMFSGISTSQRCVIPASGYYEWRNGDRQKFIVCPDTGKALVYLAGIYRVEEDGYHYAIVTRGATGNIALIHNRMPLMISDHAGAEAWLKGAQATSFINADISVTVEAEGNEQLAMRF